MNITALSDILSIKNLKYSIDDKRIIRGISLACQSHQIVAVLGQSGSGKSTLLKLIAGLLEPDSGVLFIEGTPIDPPSEKLIPGHPKIKIVKQDNPLFPNISLRENIAYELRFYEKEYREYRVNRLLKLGGLTDVADQLPRHSSEGEQQRTSIARAIAEEPSLLLLDEPFSNLDYPNKQRMKEAIQEIVIEENMACIFVTHEVSDVFGMASEVAVLKSGKIAQRDKPEVVYSSPANEYVAGLTGEYNLMKAEKFSALFGIPVTSKQVLIRPECIEFHQNKGVSVNVRQVVSKGFYQEVDLEIEGHLLKAVTMRVQSGSPGNFIRLTGFHELP